MALLLAALAFLLVGAGVALVLSRFPRAATLAGVWSAVIGCVLGLVPAAQVLAGGTAQSWRRPWHVPYGELYLAIDPLSAVFLVVIFGLSLLAAIYGGPYLLAYRDRKVLGVPWLFFNGLVASMAVLVAARNGVLFLVAWELMAVTSFFLVTFDDERPEVRGAGRTYLIASHLGTALLLAFFAILGGKAGSLDFDRFAALAGLAPGVASVLFLLAVVGFGVKAGFVPLHVWLPEAHPAAPSHVSAIMSGVMIKTGVYGILRALTFLGDPPAWWGGLLIGVGVTSGVLGVLFALAQHDLKRLLAYHSVENIGIIALGMGVGVLGLALDNQPVALLSFAGAVLHVVNHASFKGLLFLGAGSVLHATGEREMDRLGGLLKSMPVTGATFLVGAAAISGLPPLNGFVSEFLIFSGSLGGLGTAGMMATALLLAVVVSLGLIGGLALACFAKAFGVVFLGAPRTEEAAHAHEADAGMKAAMLALVAVCAFIGVASMLGVRVALPAAAQLAGIDAETALARVASASAPLGRVTVMALVVVGLAAGLALLRHLLLARREVLASPTWDCYERPTARMQYTSSSFAQPLLEVFHWLVHPRRHVHAPRGYFPAKASFHSETPDIFTDRIYRPFTAFIEWSGYTLHWLQQGRVHLYLLYIFITLVILMVWRLGFE